jgi:hypothetical protein
MEGFVSSRVGAFSSMIHVFALSTVLQTDIVSVCPSTSLSHRPLLHARISPVRRTDFRTFSVPHGHSDLVIMWSRDVIVLSATSVFEPNHVVPLFRKNDMRYNFQASAGHQAASAKTLTRASNQLTVTSFFGSCPTAIKVKKLSEPDSQQVPVPTTSNNSEQCNDDLVTVARSSDKQGNQDPVCEGVTDIGDIACRNMTTDQLWRSIQTQK